MTAGETRLLMSGVGRAGQEPWPHGPVGRARDLVRRGELDAAGALLTDVLAGESAAGDFAALFQSLRQLCVACAGHRRRADELETEARRHRALEDQIRRAIDGLVAGWAEDVPAAGGDAPATGPEAGAGWLRLMAGRSRGPSRGPPSIGDASPPGAAHEPSARAPAAVEPDVVAPPPQVLPPDAIRVRVLGPLDVVLGDLAVERWHSLKARAVFQYLVMGADRPVRRELLMETFWPGHSRESARNNLNVALHNLRRTLQDHGGGHHVLYADGRYCLNPELSWRIDRDEFLRGLEEAHALRDAGRREEGIDAYRRATEIYGGPLFEDDTLSEWHLAEQRHLEELYLCALEDLGELHLERNDPSRAAQAGEQALTSDPCRESAHRLLMRCYAEQHQQQLVSRQLQMCVNTLRRRLGVAPADETLRLFKELTAGG